MQCSVTKHVDVCHTTMQWLHVRKLKLLQNSSTRNNPPFVEGGGVFTYKSGTGDRILPFIRLFCPDHLSKKTYPSQDNLLCSMHFVGEFEIYVCPVLYGTFYEIHNLYGIIFNKTFYLVKIYPSND